MSQSNMVWIMIVFAAYMLMMIMVGLFYSTKNESSADYFLGGRGLGAFVAALSAQASDMSGWLLMGLPGAIYAAGTGQAWIAVGLFIGTVCNWLFVSGRLRRYTIRAGNAVTLPTYLENRFNDKNRILLLVSSIAIVIFFLIYTAAALVSGGRLFSSIFGVEYKLALTIGAVVILVYTFLGGFMAVCVTDFIQGMLMVIALVAVPIVAICVLGIDNIPAILDKSDVVGGSSLYLNALYNGEKRYNIVPIISQLAWGLGYCGMPHILVRFMAIKNEKELSKSKGIAILWVFISLVFSCIIGVVGRAYLYPKILLGASSESVFIEMIVHIFTSRYSLPIIAGIFLCAILAAIMSTADSQLLVTASSVAEDIYKGVIDKKAKTKKVLMISRITVVVVAVIAYIIALNPENSIMGLVSNAWAGLGASFGPIVLFSLFWRRTNFHGAVAGIVTGALTVIIWDYVPLMPAKETLGQATGLYSLAVGFALSILAIVAVSLITPPPTAEMEKAFNDVVNKKI